MNWESAVVSCLLVLTAEELHDMCSLPNKPAVTLIVMNTAFDWTALLLRIRKSHVKNLCPDTGYPGVEVYCFSVPRGKF
jgi:hypothetical protein